MGQIRQGHQSTIFPIVAILPIFPIYPIKS